MLDITLLLFVGGETHSTVEQQILQARRAATLDLLETLLETSCVERAIIATDDPAWGQTLKDLPLQLDIDPPDRRFRFGPRLAELAERYQPGAILYAGGGAAPLMSTADWLEVLHILRAKPELVVTNNLHSSDWVAFRPTQGVIPLIADQDRDNGLAWALASQGGFQVHSLPPGTSSRFDLDTPADLLIARVHPHVGPHLGKLVTGLDWPTESLEGVLGVMAGEGTQLAVIGRSSAAVWAALESATRCWVRFFAEERGMVASGRLAGGRVRSLVADLLEQVGIEGFFAHLKGLADAVLLDSRVIFGARGIWPSNADRFNADLMRWSEVEEPFLRKFSRAAARAGIPVLMGGQSVVSGGLLALLDTLKEGGVP